MKLTISERWIISNQLRILEALTPDLQTDTVVEYEKADLRYLREAVERGYEHEYDRLVHWIDPNPMSEERCREVLDILEMYVELECTYDALADKSGIEGWAIRFSGWDGNNEYEEMAFARHWCQNPTHPFEALGDRAWINGHCPTLQRNRTMLAAFKRLPRQYDLSKQDVLTVIDAWSQEKARLDKIYERSQGTSH